MGAFDVREYNATYNGIEYKIYLNKKTGEVQNVYPRWFFLYTNQI